MQEFLRKYSILPNISLSDPTWRDFFSAVVVRSQSAHSHSHLADFMLMCSVKYKEDGRAVAFVTDLLKLDVEKLLSGELHVESWVIVADRASQTELVRQS